MRHVALSALVSLSRACVSAPAQSPAPSQFGSSQKPVCGRAFRGSMSEGTLPSDSAMRRASLVMHVRQCSADTIRIPFHVDSNRSRTWVLTRTATGLRLKHDHRHEDGSEDAVTQYGGDTRSPGSATRQEFPADPHTATVAPAARTNVWYMEVIPGQRFSYGLWREGSDRRFRVDFDLARPVAPPPAPWGARP